MNCILLLHKKEKTLEDYFSTPTKETRKLQRQGLI